MLCLWYNIIHDSKNLYVFRFLYIKDNQTVTEGRVTDDDNAYDVRIMMIYLSQLECFWHTIPMYINTFYWVFLCRLYSISLVDER
jgi:hypothetical protein